MLISHRPHVKVFDHLKEFIWIEFEMTRWPLREGIGEIAVAGRSRGLGIDRIAICRDGDEEARKRATDVDAPTSSKVHLSRNPGQQGLS